MSKFETIELFSFAEIVDKIQEMLYDMSNDEIKTIVYENET